MTNKTDQEKVGEVTDSEQIYEPYPKTAKEWLKRWDNDHVWSVEMGGLGPGYEQAIQILVAEIVRDNLTIEIPGDVNEKWWDAFAEASITRCAKSCFGFSGAQVGAAKSLAFKYLSKGPREIFESLKEAGQSDRMIQVGPKMPMSPIKPIPNSKEGER